MTDELDDDVNLEERSLFHAMLDAYPEKVKQLLIYDYELSLRFPTNELALLDVLQQRIFHTCSVIHDELIRPTPETSERLAELLYLYNAVTQSFIERGQHFTH